MATLVPKTIAPPIPCRTRARRKIAALGDSPARREEAPNSSVPMVNTFLRPWMSAKRPKGRRKAAAARR